MAGRNQHVVPHQEGWAVQSEGCRRFTSVFSTKQEAIDTAQQIARRAGSKLVVHGRHGQAFRSAESPGSLDRLDEAAIRQIIRDVRDSHAKRKQR